MVVVERHGPHWMFWCAGCECAHGPTDAWTFNGDVEKPTFAPSVISRTDTTRCHLFVRDGRIQFLADCTHALAGKTVEMEPLPW